MPFNVLNIKKLYKVPRDNVVEDFIIPTMQNSISYDRAVAYFSSSALYEMTVGINGLIKNGGHIRYIISSENLSNDDIDAIHLGYEERKKIATKTLRSLFENPKNYFEEERLNIIAHLIENEILDIKVALHKNRTGIFHQKTGIFTDEIGNKIAFIGSYNETFSAMYKNTETIGTFSSIAGDIYEIDDLELDFNVLWNNQDEFDEVIDFPDDLKSEIAKFKKDQVDYEIDEKEFKKNTEKTKPVIPTSIKFYDYQDEAVDQWFEHNCCGIFDMATGSGKTWTALKGITELIQREKVAVIICCPYQHLVDQWCEDLKKWAFTYISGYTGSQTKNWKKKLENTVLNFNRKVLDYMCFITTNASFRTPYVQKQIEIITGKTLLVVDEAHNFGAGNLRKLLFDRYTYRLALSATLDRYNDDVGTNALYNFFGEKCVVYTLKDAINHGQLTKYFYYPIPVYLTPSELENYNDVSEQIKKETRINDKTHEVYLTERGKQKCIERARLVAGASNKIAVLDSLMEKEEKNNHILVYCGATTVNDIDFDDRHANSDDLRQIDAVTSLLYKKHGMLVSKFTSEEDSATRRILIRQFAEGTSCQVLAAIKCLDEGVSIKSIEKAFILASSVNPREYVQRRGRVLRLYEGKQYAYIYDFITLPRPLNKIEDFMDLSNDYSLIKREMIRMLDFAELSENPSDTDRLKRLIEEKYKRNDEYGCR